MSNRAAYPRSSARPIYVTAGVLGLLGLAGVIVMLIAMADVPRQSYYLLIAAFGLLVVALALFFLALLALGLGKLLAQLREIARTRRRRRRGDRWRGGLGGGGRRGLGCRARCRP